MNQRSESHTPVRKTSVSLAYKYCKKNNTNTVYITCIVRDITYIWQAQ